MNRDIERNGTLKACQELRVSVIARSPLKQGLLTQDALSRTDLDAQAVRPLLLLLKFVGALGGGKTVEQIALNYLLCQGVVCIPSVETVGEVIRNAGAMGWRMEASELEVVNEKLTYMGF